LCHRLPDILAGLHTGRWLIDGNEPVDMVLVQPERLIRIQFAPRKCRVYLYLAAIFADALLIELCIVNRGFSHINDIIIRLQRYV
jgi:hypothetical protein